MGILQTTVEHAQEDYRAGSRAVVLELAWDRAEPAPGWFDYNYLVEKQAEMEAYQLLRYQVTLDLGMQYPPAWVFDLPHARYMNQFGDVFCSSEPGVDIPNAVFSQAVRDAQERYVRHVFRVLRDDFVLVRLGWMKYGELAYPAQQFNGHANCYWSFGDLAQGKATGLAQGLAPCPTPGWLPGSGLSTPTTARDFLV